MDVVTKLLMDPGTLDLAIDIIYNQQLDFDDIMKQLDAMRPNMDMGEHNHMTNVVVEYLTWANAQTITGDRI